jgi:hypothetical protein
MKSEENIMADRDFGIIGGGAAGISCGKFLSATNYSFEIIERNDDFGGLWDINSKSALVYESTHLISSKLNTQFSDFPMPENYPSYPNHRLYLDYLRSIARKYSLYEHAIFNTTVVLAKPIESGWQLELSTGETRTYRYLIICNGRLNKPIIPNIDGTFNGEILHSVNYRNPKIFEGKNVLIIGSGNTACDVAVDAVHFAKKVFQSARRGYHYMPKFIQGMPTQDWMMQIGNKFSSEKELWDYIQKTFKSAGFDGEDYGLPKPDHEIYQAHPIMNSLVLYHIGHGDIVAKTDIKQFLDSEVEFIDNSKEKIDLILYATGYEPNFPFLDPLDIKIDDDFSQAYMFMFDKKYDNLFYGGYVNAPSGFGNVANACGNLLKAYIGAKENNTAAYEKFLKIKKEDNPDLGRDRYVSTKRHNYEVDLWVYIKTLNFLTSKLSQEK